MSRRYVLALLLVAGCASATEAIPRATPTPVALTTSAAPTEPAAQPAEPAPVLATTGQDFAVIWNSIHDYRTWLFRNPDPAGLDAIYLPECSCHAEGTATLAEYLRQGQRWTGARPVVTEVQVLDDADPDLVTLRTTTVRDGSTELVDATGAVVQSFPALAPTFIDVVLRREDPGAPWRVRDLANQGPTSGALR